MNNQSLILWAIGTFVVLIVAVAAVDQYLLDEHPPTEVDGLIWLVENSFSRIQDMEATLQVTTEGEQTQLLRMAIKYVKGPPPVFSMRYVPPQDGHDNRFVAQNGNEAFAVVNDQLTHYIPSAGILVSKRWPGFPLVQLGLGFFDLSQLHADWDAGRVDIQVQQNVRGIAFSGLASSIRVGNSFTLIPTLDTPFENIYTLCSSLSVSECDEPESRLPGISTTLGEAPGFDETVETGSYVLEVRDAATSELTRMIWVNRDSYLAQKVVTFKDGKRVSTMLVQLVTIDQGLTELDVIPPPQPGAVHLRG